MKTNVFAVKNRKQTENKQKTNRTENNVQRLVKTEKERSDSERTFGSSTHRAFSVCLYSGRSLTHDGSRWSHMAGEITFAVGTDAVAESMVL